METLKNKLLYEYKNKNFVYYNSEIANDKLKTAVELLKQTLNKEQLKLLDNYEGVLKLYKNELTIEIVSFIFDYIKNKLELN